jgi:hypothetical protein
MIVVFPFMVWFSIILILLRDIKVISKINSLQIVGFNLVAVKIHSHNRFYEGRFVHTVANWHKASDGRGLSEDVRSTYNHEMLHFLLEDWMPWFRNNYDFSTIDINR